MGILLKFADSLNLSWKSNCFHTISGCHSLSDLKTRPTTLEKLKCYKTIGSRLAHVHQVTCALRSLLGVREVALKSCNSAIASYDSYYCLVRSNLPRASITGWTHAN